MTSSNLDDFFGQCTQDHPQIKLCKYGLHSKTFGLKCNYFNNLSNFATWQIVKYVGR